MQVRFCIDGNVRAALFRAGYELPDVVESDVPLAELHPDTRSYLWELFGEGVHRPLTLRVPQWDAALGCRRQIAWGAPLVPATAPEWEDVLAAYRAAAHDAEAATAAAEAQAGAAIVQKARWFVWGVPLGIAVLLGVLLDVVLPFPSLAADPDGFITRVVGVVVAAVFLIHGISLWGYSLSVLWQDRQHRRAVDAALRKVAG